MPRPGALAVKREPLSDDDDRDGTSQYEHAYLTTQSSDGLEDLAPLAPAAPTAIPVFVKQEPVEAPPAATLETLEPVPYSNAKGSALMDRHLTMVNEAPDSSDFSPLLNVKDEPLSEGEQQHLSGEDTSDSCGAQGDSRRGSPKSWTQQDMEDALEALRKHNMSLTKASARYGIPSTTLWQRAHRLGIDTPKKESVARAWGASELRAALHALRAGAISANKASKAYGIPSSTLYKIARREGIRLAPPFNAAPTSWRRADLDRALHAIRCGAASVQRAAQQFGIPTGTLYGRCKREGIELSRSSPAPWSEAAMVDALEAVRVGQMSINQAAIHYNLPYSSLYGRFKRYRHLAPDTSQVFQHTTPENNEMDQNQVPDMVPYCQPPMPPHTVHNSDHATLNDTQTPYRHEHLDENVVFADQYSQYYQGCSSVVSS